MKLRYNYIISFAISIIFSGCHLFESTKVPAKEIKAASSWTDKDQGPSFPECETIEDGQQNYLCFESIISNSILDYITDNPLESTEYISEEVSLVLKIDNEGYFSIIEVIRSSAMDNAIPNLEDQLQSAVSIIPKAEPALKTNVGAFVSTKLVLPIMIIAE
ncbi:MAG: hypothetical protein CMC63_08875 [Flavobacteriaceae bacterium]|nr:hypothetical protein [Flavobacteriaceae bacterium]